MKINEKKATAGTDLTAENGRAACTAAEDRGMAAAGTGLTAENAKADCPGRDAAGSAASTGPRRRISELAPDGDPLILPRPLKKEGNRVHILALGDVGATLLLGLKVLGGGLVDTIGIYDMNEKVMARYEMEMNQIGWPMTGAGEALTTDEKGQGDGLAAGLGGVPGVNGADGVDGRCKRRPGMQPTSLPSKGRETPRVVCLTEAELFDCDLFIFCASKAVPQLGVKGDVRMMQLEANSKIAAHYGKLAKAADFKGIFAVVSDPVDPLCKAVLMASGLAPGQVRGYGLGVMNKRAEYYAARDPRLAMYLKEGRAFGPHGGDLVIANSISHYDDALSKELTKLTVEANLRVRDLGFKPYFAPAFSSGAMSLLLTLAGEWHYSSVYLGKGSEGAFLGVRNRIENISDGGARACYEDLALPQLLYERIELAYRNLCQLL